MNKSAHSTESISNEGEDGTIDEITDATKIILTFAYVIILLFSFVGNSLLIHIVRTRTDIRKKTFNWLLVNTAIADLVDVITASAFCLSFFTAGDRWIPGIVGTILCKIIPFFLVVSICVSIWTLTVIAADRYLAIVNIRKKPLSSRLVLRSIIAIWLCAGFLFCGQLYKFKTEETEDGESECYHDWHEDSSETSILFYKAEMIVRVVITYAVPLLIMAVLYWLIAMFLWKRKPPGNFHQQVYNNRIRRRRAVIKMMITAVTVFALCWFPVHVGHIMSEFYSNTYDTIPIIVKWLFYWLAHANTAIHPWLFIFFSENLRVETKEIFRNIWKTTRLHACRLSLFSNVYGVSALEAFTTRNSYNVAERTV